MAPGDDNQYASGEINMEPLMEAIVSVKQDVNQRMEGLERDLSRKMDTLEVRLKSTTSSPQNYHSSSSGNDHNTATTITLKTLDQMLYLLIQVQEPTLQAPTYINNRNYVRPLEPQLN